MPAKYQVFKNPVVPVGAHAWNGDRTQVAISPNSNLVHVYEFKAGAFNLLHTLSEHTQRVAAIDWAPNSNRLLTCSADRNAYVWELEGSAWKPTLVILRINRAATCCKWSPLENKFAVGSGARLISICYFEEENNWWVSKHIKKPIRSTVVSLDWHPNNILIAAGSSDFTCRVFSAYIKAKNEDGVAVDEKPAATAWGKKMPFAAIMGEFGTSAPNGGWIHDVSFSASGDELVYVGHDASITVVDAGNEMAMSRFESKDLPYRAVSFVTPNSIIAGGHNYAPVLYTYTDGALAYGGVVDQPPKKAAKAMSAMAKFQTLDRKGTASSDKTDTAVNTTHQNAISEICMFEGDKGDCKKFSTAGVDGKIVVWDMSEIRALDGINVA